MRIVSGDARGIRLQVPAGGEALRPTEARVKESLFATLGDLNGAVVLDLFSGTGALGLEALSRGAAKVVMVERDRFHAAAIQENLMAVCRAIRAAGREPGAAVILQEDLKNITQLLENQVFTIIVADPPYQSAPEDYGAVELLQDRALGAHCTSATLLALEHAAAVADLPWHPRSPWRLLRRRTFGIRAVSYAQLAEPAAAEHPEEFV